MKDCLISSLLLFPLVCKLIRQQQLIGADGSDSLPLLAQILEGGTVDFIAGQKDFHQGLAVTRIPPGPLSESLALNGSLVTRSIPEDPDYFHCLWYLYSPFLMNFSNLKALLL